MWVMKKHGEVAFLCKVSAFFFIIYMMISPIILCLMMLARYNVVQWPLTSTFRNKTFVKKIIELFLTVAICFCILLISGIFPILGKNVPTDICLPAYTSKDQSLFVLFMSLIVILIQMGSLFVMVSLSILLIVTLYKLEKRTYLQTRNSKLGKVAKHLIMVIVTNIFCWVPSNIVLILALTGYQLSNVFFSWIILIVIPINSMLDPLFLQ